MSDAVIEATSLSKRYVIGRQAASGEGLRHAIERAVLASSPTATELDPGALGLMIGNAAAPPVAEATGAGGRVPPTGLSLADGERAMIERALSEANGNQTKAARLLGISRDTLRYRMAKSKITI